MAAVSTAGLMLKEAAVGWFGALASLQARAAAAISKVGLRFIAHDRGTFRTKTKTAPSKRAPSCHLVPRWV